MAEPIKAPTLDEVNVAHKYIKDAARILTAPSDPDAKEKVMRVRPIHNHDLDNFYINGTDFPELNDIRDLKLPRTYKKVVEELKNAGLNENDINAEMRKLIKAKAVVKKVDGFRDPIKTVELDVVKDAKLLKALEVLEARELAQLHESNILIAHATKNGSMDYPVARFVVVADALRSTNLDPEASAIYQYTIDYAKKAEARKIEVNTKRGADDQIPTMHAELVEYKKNHEVIALDKKLRAALEKAAPKKENEVAPFPHLPGEKPKAEGEKKDGKPKDGDMGALANPAFDKMLAEANVELEGSTPLAKRAGGKVKGLAA